MSGEPAFAPVRCSGRSPPGRSPHGRSHRPECGGTGSALRTPARAARSNSASGPVDDSSRNLDPRAADRTAHPVEPGSAGDYAVAGTVRPPRRRGGGLPPLGLRLPVRGNRMGCFPAGPAPRSEGEREGRPRRRPDRHRRLPAHPGNWPRSALRSSRQRHAQQRDHGRHHALARPARSRPPACAGSTGPATRSHSMRSGFAKVIVESTRSKSWPVRNTSSRSR